MGAALTTEQVRQYREKGYLFPLQILNATEVAGIQDAMRQARKEGEARELSGRLEQYFRVNAQLVMPFVCEVAGASELLDRVESILGPDLLLWSAEFFIKPAGSEKIVSWHQDLTYWGLGETDQELTAWLALSDVNVESGCMRFLPGSHHQRILPHRDTFAESNLLSRGQEVAVEVDENEAVDVILKPGQMSFHHGRIFHASGPNHSDGDRIGLAFRFITPQVRQRMNRRDYAMPMRGHDKSGHWIHVVAPDENFASTDLELYDRVRADQNSALAQGLSPDQKLHGIG